VPLDRLWSFLSALKANDENGNLAIPDARPNDDALKALAKEALGGNKGAGWAARLFEECELHELPATVTKPSWRQCSRCSHLRPRSTTTVKRRHLSRRPRRRYERAVRAARQRVGMRRPHLGHRRARQRQDDCRAAQGGQAESSNGMQPGQSALFLSFSRAAVARILDAAKLETTKGGARAAVDPDLSFVLLGAS
jgi:hypothetical protein